MKANCILCGEEISRADLVIASASSKSTFNYKPYHKQCFKDFRCEGKISVTTPQGNANITFPVTSLQPARGKGYLFFKWEVYDLRKPGHWIITLILYGGISYFAYSTFAQEGGTYELIFYILMGIFIINIIYKLVVLKKYTENI